MLRKNKKAELLQENVIFIVLNVAFFSIMILFLYLQSSSIHIKEEETAKQIALLIDASKPGSEIELNLENFFEKIKINKERSITIDNNKNIVVVRGTENSLYEYSYFNEVNVEYNLKENKLILIVK
ncbi:MAG: hypothetical protein PHH54_04170 [Candidatus Nanoarchaeia archaeon]|nr:hypothetical protein [Candidatus Nanoarchaeia archaeon]MDD5741156.1 hypothetical protein [Candidatus Nanoarchaeia archaeon]